MKFRCGLTQAEEDAEYRADWHDCFAWWPTEVAKGDCRWLETIQRRGQRYVYVHCTVYLGIPEYRAKP